MAHDALTTMGMERFIELAEECGFEIDVEDLKKMQRRSLLEPWESDGASVYTALHLVVLARYLKAVRQHQHPWGTATSEVTTGEVTRFCGQLNRFLDEATGDREGSFSASIKGVVAEIEEFLDDIAPFGPLGEVFDLLRPQVISKMRNQGRLYAEVARASAGVFDRLDNEVVAEPKTRQMYDMQPEDGDEPSDRTRETIDEVVSAAEDSAQEVDEEPADGSDSSQPVDDGGRGTQVIQMRLEPEDEGLDEGSSEPIVLVDDEDGETHVAESASDVEDSPDDDQPPKGPPPSPAEKKAAFEERCEQMLEQQQWEQLAELYESRGVEMVSTPVERQQMFLELGRLYEVKLRDKDRAFSAFDRAWAERESTSHREEALEGIERIGKSSGFHDRYLQWLRDQMSKELKPNEEARFSKELARGLFADQRYEEAFEAYASFLLDTPERHLTDETLGQLDRLGEHVDGKRVDRCYDALQKRDIDEITREMINDFASGAQV